MKLDKASEVEQICYQIRLSDYPRSKNRALINNLFNGVPPFDEDSAEANGVNINVNPLGATVLGHDARAQFYGAILRPGRYFDAATDYGPKHKRSSYSEIVTEQMNRKMKRSKLYYETFRSKFAMDVLHGIGPSAWRNRDRWCPDAVAIEDIGIPANTLLTMENLPFFYIYRTFTLPEIIRLTNRAKVEKGWNMDLVAKLIKWVDEQTSALMGTNWPEVWSPEKTAERVKGDGGFYSSDQVPTINCFDFYFWNDEDKVEGWNRRMILDAWSEPSGSGGAVRMARNKDMDFAKNEFLFNPGKRKYADKLSELLTFQFADLSAVAPFRYHTVRSMGYLVYGVCNLQNRMFCRFSEAAFEASMNYIRINSADDADRALKIDLVNRGVIDKSVEFVKPADRWQVNESLIQMAMNENRRIIETNSSSFTQQGPQQSTGDRKTKFQVMAEIQQTTALVQSAFNQAYRYQEDEYQEIFRRFCKSDSDDIDVREFRAACLKRGVPDKVLMPDCWDIKPTQVMGAGNKTMEMAISEQLLGMRNLFDPEPQREILREVTFNLTGDAGKAERWVPEQPVRVTDSVHDAQLATGTLMQGLPVSVKTGMNHREYVVTMLGNLQMLIQKAQQSGGMATMEQIQGFGAVAQHIDQHLKILAQDKEEKQFVAAAGKTLAKLMNFVKAFAQRLQEQQKKAQQNGAGMDPQEQAKVKTMMMSAQAKIQSSKESHTQRTAQKQIQFDAKMKQDAQAFEMDQQRKNIEALHEMNRKRMASMSEDDE